MLRRHTRYRSYVGRPASRRTQLAHRVRHAVAPHSHDLADTVDSALEASREGTRALKLSVLVLGVTAVVQAAVVVLTGSVALLSDTLHNFADALTAVPLGIAFGIGRRAPRLTKRPLLSPLRPTVPGRWCRR